MKKQNKQKLTEFLTNNKNDLLFVRINILPTTFLVIAYFLTIFGD